MGDFNGTTVPVFVIYSGRGCDGARAGLPAEFIDNNGKDNEVRKRESESAGAGRPQAGTGTISQADEKRHPGRRDA